MNAISRRRFLKLAAAAGGALAFGDLADQMMGFTRWTRSAYAAEPIKVGIIDPLSSPYKTSSIHDVHGATVALEMYNKRGGVLGRQVAIIQADDASNVQTAIKAADKLIRDDRLSRGPHRGQRDEAKRHHPESLRLGLGQRAESLHQAGAGQGEDRRRRHDWRRADRAAAGVREQRRCLGFDLGPEDQHGKLAPLHSGRDRQVQPYTHVALLPRLRSHDANPGSGASGRHDRHGRRDQIAGRARVRRPEGRTVLLPRLGPPACAGRARRAGLRQGARPRPLPDPGYGAGRRRGGQPRPERLPPLTVSGVGRFTRPGLSWYSGERCGSSLPYRRSRSSRPPWPSPTLTGLRMRSLTWPPFAPRAMRPPVRPSCSTFPPRPRPPRTPKASISSGSERTPRTGT